MIVALPGYLLYYSTSTRKVMPITLRKHAYSYILRILPPKTENFHMKNYCSFHISAQNIDCGYLLEPPTHNLCFFSRSKEINVFPSKLQFYCIKVGFKGVKTI